MSTLDQLTAQLDRLAAIDPGPFPVLSLYLDLRPDSRGRDNFGPFLRKELAERVGTYGASAPERESLEKDAERVRTAVENVDGSLNGLALFSCSGADLFESIPLAASPIDGHRLYLSDQPHLYPLAKLLDEYPRYVALVADTNRARIFVFAANAIEQSDEIKGTKTRRHKMGGWSQARYQRHTENYHVHHAKDVVDALDRIVREDGIDKVVIAGDEVILPLLREQMPKHLQERIVDTMKLDIRTSERDVLDETIAALRERDAESDRERVDELLVPGAPDAIQLRRTAGDGDAQQAERTPQERTADTLVALARQTSARIRFIEDAALLEPARGVGAFLRFKL